MPKQMNQFVPLTITYIVGAAASAMVYFVFEKNGNLVKESSKLNWALLVLGIVIVRLETGWIYTICLIGLVFINYSSKYNCSFMK